MLTSHNSGGKYLYKKWSVDRALALEDRTRFSDDELEWLEITADEGLGNTADDAFEMDTNPIDPETRSTVNAIDIRKLPNTGK